MHLSIIIPILNEEKILPTFLKYILATKSPNDEIIIVDGGSKDNSVKIASSYPVKLFKTKASRAVQMNVGANNAVNEILYFLHADCKPPKSFNDDIETAIKKGYKLGGYQLKIGEQEQGLKKINSFFSQLDLLIFQGGGDQSLFITKTLFTKMNGFNENYVIMEDFELIRRLRRLGYKKAILNNYIQSSDRKYESNGYLKVQLANLMAYSAFSFGVNPAMIKSIYKKILTDDYD